VKKITFRELGLSSSESRVMKRLSTPIKIQNYLDGIPMNFDDSGLYLSPRRVMREKKAHCLEGALFAASALWAHGEKPLIVDMLAEAGDQDHVIALYKRNRYWGAISKTNHATIRFRDPVYRTVRELVLSYFHEWFMNSNGKKTLRSYSFPLDMRRFGEDWVTAETDLSFVDAALDRVKHYDVVPRGNEKHIRLADRMELKAGRLIEWKRTRG
jgi:hypothetical protein